MKYDYVIKLLETDERLDGRKLDEFRKIEILTNNIKRAEGSARVKIGKTDVIVGIKMDMGEPYPDVPDEGMLRSGAEFSPIASEEFDPGKPGEDAIELARVVDRGIRESHSIDLEKLCLEPGKKVWTVFVDVHIINHDGNLIDASALGSIIALKNTKIPTLEDEKVNREKLTKALPLNHIPITITVGKIKDKLIIDPTKEEEQVIDSKVTISIMEDGKVCSMQKSGNIGFSEEDIKKMIDLAVKKSKEIRKLL
jgi:exosome complex component RRP42